MRISAIALSSVFRSAEVCRHARRGVKRRLRTISTAAARRVRPIGSSLQNRENREENRFRAEKRSNHRQKLPVNQRVANTSPCSLEQGAEFS
jgi:hypothetical protein